MLINSCFSLCCLPASVLVSKAQKNESPVKISLMRPIPDSPFPHIQYPQALSVRKKFLKFWGTVSAPDLFYKEIPLHPDTRYTPCRILYLWPPHAKASAYFFEPHIAEPFPIAENNPFPFVLNGILQPKPFLKILSPCIWSADPPHSSLFGSKFPKNPPVHWWTWNPAPAAMCFFRMHCSLQ